MIETFTALTIILTSITFGLTVASTGFFYSDYAIDQLTASYLAQEGLELVTLARDNLALNALPSNLTLSGFTVACQAGPGCDIEAIDHQSLIPEAHQCDPQCPPISLAEGASDSFFVSFSAEDDRCNCVGGYTLKPTKFTRKIEVVETLPTEWKVSATVFWNDRAGLGRQIKVEQILHDWP